MIRLKIAVSAVLLASTLLSSFIEIKTAFAV